MNKDVLFLRVSEAYPRDVRRGVARIDYGSMDALNASNGDVIEINGKGRTVAKCLALYSADEGKGIIRIDGLGRDNSGIVIGDTVTVRKVKAVAAERVIMAPVRMIPPIDERYLADALECVPLIKGDNVAVPYFGGHLKFQVIDVTPTVDVVLVARTTIFHVAEVAKDKTSRIPEIAGLRELLKDLGTVKKLLEGQAKGPDPGKEKQIKKLVDSMCERFPDVEGKIHAMLGLSQDDVAEMLGRSEAESSPSGAPAWQSPGRMLERSEAEAESPPPLHEMPKDQPVYMFSASSAEEIAFVSDVLKSNHAPNQIKTIKESEQKPGNLFALICRECGTKTVTLAVVKTVQRSGHITFMHMAENLVIG